MGLFNFLGPPSVLKLRKKYDKVREKTDKLHNIEKRMELLHQLDQVETTIVSLEEHQLSNYERKKLSLIADANIKKVRIMIDEEKKESKLRKGRAHFAR